MISKQQQKKTVTTIKQEIKIKEIGLQFSAICDFDFLCVGRYNAINEGLYLSLPLALREASADWPNTRVTVIAGSRKSPYFSSGNDLSDFLKSFKKEQGTQNAGFFWTQFWQTAFSTF